MATGGTTNIFDEIIAQSGALGREIAEQLKKTYDVNDILNQIKSVDKEATAIARSFGVGRENLLNINKAITESTTDVILLGGKWEDVSRIQSEITSNLGRNSLANNETIKGIVASSKVAGVESSVLVKNFSDAGFSAAHISGQMKDVVKSAREIGVNAQAVSSMAVTNMSSMNQFNFQGGVEGLSKMAAQAVNLRIDMKQTLNLAEKLFDPEKAIEMAAAMQRLGVTQSDLLDPLRLMDLATNDPGELQNQIADMAKQFVHMKENGQFEILPEGKKRLMEISKELGISYGEISKMALAGSEFEDKLKKIKFPDNAFSDEQEKFIANMAQMNEKGEYELRIDGKVYGLDEGIDKLAESARGDNKLFDKFMEDNKPKSMEELAKDQLSVLESIAANTAAARTLGYAFAGSKGGKDLLDFTKVTANITGEAFRSVNLFGKDTKQQSKTFDDLATNIEDFASILTGEGSLSESFEGLAGTFVTMGENMETNWAETIKNSSESLNKLTESGNLLSKSLGSILDVINTGKIPTKETGIGNTEEKIKINESNKELENQNIKIGNESAPIVNVEIPENKKVKEGFPTVYDDLNMGGNQPAEGSLKIEFTHSFNGVPPEIDETKLREILSKTMDEQQISEKIIEVYNKTISGNGMRFSYRPTQPFGY